MIIINKSCIAPAGTVISHAKVYCTKLIHKLLAYRTLYCNSHIIYYACTGRSVEHVAGYAGAILGIL